MEKVRNKLIITGNNILSEDRKSLNFNGGIKPENLKKYLLYWDEIVYVDSSYFNINLDVPELKILAKEKILSKEIIQFPKNPKNINLWFESRPLAQLQYYITNQNNPNFNTTMVQTGNLLQLPIEAKKNNILFELSLENCLPVPSTSSIEDILEFKMKYIDLFDRFRFCLDNMNKKVFEAEKPLDEYKKFKNEMAISLNEIRVVMQENKFQNYLSNFKKFINLGDSSTANILYPFLGYLTGNRYSIPPELGAIAGLGMNAAIEGLTKEQPKINKLDSHLKDFVYLFYVEKLE